MRAVFAALFLYCLAGCDDPTPPHIPIDGGESPTQDGGNAEDWAPWPPISGNAGLRLTWMIDAAPPSGSTCASVNLARLTISFVHPVVDSKTWTNPILTEKCEKGEIYIEITRGLTPGRYRFEVALERPDGTTGYQKPSGEISLVAEAVTDIAIVNISNARAFDAGV